MRALGLWQPYPTLIAMGIKTIESRPWSTTLGPVLFCSTQALAPDFDLALYMLHMRSDLLGGSVDFTGQEFNRGVMICVSHVIDVRRLTPLDERYVCAKTTDERGDPKWGFILGRPRLVKQKPVTCRQRWFNVPDEMIEYLPETRGVCAHDD